MQNITLKAARVNAGYTQEEVAEILGISRSTIVNWENGRIAPKISDLDTLAKLYNVSIDFIFLPYNSTKSKLKKEN